VLTIVVVCELGSRAGPSRAEIAPRVTGFNPDISFILKSEIQKCLSLTPVSSNLYLLFFTEKIAN